MTRPEISALDQRLAAPMFWVTVLFLTLSAGVLHLSTEMSAEDAFPESAQTTSSSPTGEQFPITKVVPEALVLSQTTRTLCLWGMLLLFPLFSIEALLHWRGGGRFTRQHLLSCLLPPLRLGTRDHQTGRSIWLPRVGWTTTDEDLLQRVERGANLPMILIALLVLPLLAFEHFYLQQIQESAWLSLFVQISAALIWLAFAFEFVVMISIAEKKWRYAREHWVDLLIIMIPMVDFLRALRLSRLLRMQQVLKSLRLFRLRGTLLRAWRAVLLLEVVDRFLRPRPEKRLKQLHEIVAQQERELVQLKQEIAEIEDELQAIVPAGVEEPAA